MLNKRKILDSKENKSNNIWCRIHVGGEIMKFKLFLEEGKNHFSLDFKNKNVGPDEWR